MNAGLDAIHTALDRQRRVIARSRELLDRTSERLVDAQAAIVRTRTHMVIRRPSVRSEKAV